MKKLYWTIALTVLCSYLSAQTQDYGYSVNPDLTSFTSNSTDPIQGSFAVGAMGNATFAVPIAVPQGINNLQPSLSLCYNSLSGNGMCGLGFNLSGLSTIVRVSGNLFYDNCTADKAANSDYWAMALDGQRLITVDNSTFHLENDPLSKGYFNGGTASIIIEKDGFNYKYDKIFENTDIYYLRYISDSYGNTISYSYYLQDNYAYVSNIKYGVGTGLTEIKFEYETRDDVVYFFNNASGKIKLRLHQIEITKNNVLFKKYLLHYIMNNGVSVISMIKEQFDETVIKNPIYFTWGDYNFNAIKDKTAVSITNYSTTEIKDLNPVPGDFDGDGIDDLILISSNEKIPTENGGYSLHSYAYYYKCSSNGIDPVFSYLKKIDLGPDINVEGINNYQVANFLYDFDGDGINELLILSLNVNEYFRLFDITIYRYNEIKSLFRVKLTEKTSPAFTIGDYYGTGTSSIILVEKKSKTSEPIEFQILSYNHSTNNFESHLFNAYLPGTPENIQTGDFDGDGLMDILVVCKDASMVFWNRGTRTGNVFSDAYTTKLSQIKSSTTIIRVGDFDGDGKSEIFYNVPGSTDYNFIKNNGNRTFTTNTAISLTDIFEITDSSKDDDKYCVEVADINYDGKSDVLISKAMYKHHNNKSWYDFTTNYDCWLTSNGDELRKLSHLTWNPSSPNAYYRYTVGDFNGDGFKEILRLGTDNVWFIHKSFNNINKIKSLNKISSITTLANDTIRIDYCSLLDPNVYQKGNNAEYPLLDVATPNLQVVSSVTQTNGAAPAITTNYKFYSLKAHLRGRGILGFDSIEISKPQFNQTTVNAILQRDSDFFIPVKTKNADNLGNSSIVEYTINRLDGNNYFAYPHLTETTDIYGNKAITTNNCNPKSGYLVSNKVIYSDSSYIQTDYDNYQCINNIYYPSLVTKTQKHNDDPKTYATKTYYEYTPKGSVTKQISNYKTDYALTTLSEYDNLGNVIKEKTFGNGNDTILTHYIYDESGRFVSEKLSTPSDTRTLYSYDDYDNLISETDATDNTNPLTTRFKYDIWGRNIETILPDNTTNSTFYGWKDYQTKFVVSMGTAKPWSKTYYDNAGHIIREETITFATPSKGIASVTEYSYNKFGKVETTITTTGNYVEKATDLYDNYGRLSKHIDNVHTVNYSYAKNKTEITDNGRTTVTTYDDWDNIKSVTEPDGNVISYCYNSNGKPSKITSSDDACVELTYYTNGLRKSITDTDSGTELYEYDAFGNITKHVNSKNITTLYYYDKGLLAKSVCDTVATYYEYDIKSRLTNLHNITSSISYIYDKYGRLSKETFNIDNKDFVYQYKYNRSGLLSSKSFPDNSVETYYYDCFGTHFKTLLDTCDIWTLTCDSADTKGIFATESIGNKISKTSFFNTKGALETVDFYSIPNHKSLSINQKYSYDNYMNMIVRQINGYGEDTFAYDDADRLTKYNDDAVSYSNSGNIMSKTNIGDYEYSAQQPHAITFVSDPDNLIKPFDMTIEYTAFKKPGRIADTKTNGDIRTYTITYAPDQNRIKSEFKDGDNSLVTYYLPDFEQEIQNGIKTTRHYVYSPSGMLAAINIRQGGSNDTYLAITDHQGSLISLYDCSLRIKYSARYSPFGVRTITQNDLAYNLPRGYTMHEHLDEFGLINMNSRLYSPYLSRFLAPDPYIQEPTNSQNFNRYSYCLNNPLKYTDPNGEKWLPWVIGAFLLDPVSFCVTACATATAGIGLFTTVTASGLMPFQGTLFAISIPTKNYGKKISNAFQIDVGMFRAKNFWHWNSRYSWESLQTGVGNMYSHVRNIFGKVDRVDYYDGATFCVDENNKDDKNNGITLGNYININIDDAINSDFETYLKTSHNGLFMHEYGHTIQGRRYGLAYLFYIGIPSLISAKNSVSYYTLKQNLTSTHKQKWYEREASRYGRDYFKCWTTTMEDIYGL